jgi:transposase
MFTLKHPRCAGLDLHKRQLTACRLTPGEGADLHAELRTFGTMTRDLLALSDWLAEGGCTHVVMESTGVFWKPVYNLLEGTFTLVLVNPEHVKALTGRKSDVQDAERLAQLLARDQLAGSFVPDRPQRELRELTRYRTALVRERATAVNRLQKTLEGANLKLASVASDLQGKSARAMLVALAGGETDPERLAELARGRLREKLPELKAALQGCVGEHQRFLLGQQLAHLAELDERIRDVSEEVARRLAPFEAQLRRLEQQPGVGRRTAEVIVAEVGLDMRRFPTHRHCVSWAGMCPGQHESGGKRKRGGTRKGSPWLRTALVEAARAASRTKDSYSAAQYQRLARRRGANRAAMAVGHSILVASYYLLRDDGDYRELGGHYFDERDRTQIVRQNVRRLRQLGYAVELREAAAA